MAEKRARKVTVLNTTGTSHVLNKTGVFIFPAQEREVDPTDPFTAALIAKGYLIIQEG